MIEDAEARGLIKPGDTLIESSSGNTGIAMAGISKIKGYKMVVILPDTASTERINIIRKLGGIVITNKSGEGRARGIEIAKNLADINGWKMLNQYDNQANTRAHYKTGNEIVLKLKELNAHPDFLVLGVGTGGTITGISTILRAEYPNIKIIGIVPLDRVEGLRGFEDHKPGILDLTKIDEIVKVSELEAKQSVKELAEEKGLLIGISSGAAYFISKKLAIENPSSKIITLFPDGLDKYLSYI